MYASFLPERTAPRSVQFTALAAMEREPSGSAVRRCSVATIRFVTLIVASPPIGPRGLLHRVARAAADGVVQETGGAGGGRLVDVAPVDQYRRRAGHRRPQAGQVEVLELVPVR